MNEYIERAAVHELVKRLPKYQMFNYDRTESLTGINPDDVDFGVDKIPAADVVEMRHAKWKYFHKQNKAVCTNCSFERDLDADFGRAIVCPNCGAPMTDEAVQMVLERLEALHDKDV